MLANLVIIPLSTLAIGAGFVSLLVGLAGLTPLSVVCNTAAVLILYVMDWLARQGTGLPGAYFPASFTRDWMAPASLVLMTAVMLAGVAGHWSRRYGGYWPPVAVLALILAFGVRFG